MELSLSKMTTLGAVNAMLRHAMQAPVTTLEASTLRVDALKAFQQLEDTNREVQERGWWFNTLDEQQTAADINGRIPLPENTLSVRVAGSSRSTTYLIYRDGFLFDPKTNSFVIGSTPKVRLVLGYDFSELPPAAQTYIVAKAAREYAPGELSSTTTYRITQEKEDRAFAALQAAEAEAEDSSLYDMNPHFKTHRRR